MVTYIVLSIYLIAYLLSSYKQKYAVFFFLSSLVIRPLIEYRLFELTTLNLPFIFILFSQFIIKGNAKRILFKSRNEYINLLVKFVYFFCIIELWILLKEYFLLHYNEQDFSVVFKMILYKPFVYLNLAIIIKELLPKREFSETVINSLKFSITLIVLSMFTSPFLLNIGINIRDEVKDNVSAISDLGRVAGLYGGGDVNSLSGLINLGISVLLLRYFFIKNELNIPVILFLSLFSIGILFTASRMGFLVMIAVYLIFFLMFYVFSKRPKESNLNKIWIFIAFAFIGFLIFQFISENSRFSLVLSRIAEQGTYEQYGQEGMRTTRWIRFLSFILSNIWYTLFGATTVYYDYEWGGYHWVDPHNFFIRLFYLGGLLFIIPLFNFIIKLTKYSIREHFLKQFIFISIPVLISLMVVSQWAFMYYYFILVAILFYNTRYKIYEAST